MHPFLSFLAISGYILLALFIGLLATRLFLYEEPKAKVIPLRRDVSPEVYDERDEK